MCCASDFLSPAPAALWQWKWLCRHSKHCNRWVGDFAMLSCHHSQKGWYLPHVLSQNWYHTDLIRRICLNLQVPFMAWPQGLSLQPFHSLETLAYAFSIFFLCNCAHVLGLPLNQVRKVALVTGFEEQILRSIPAEELWKCSLPSFRNFSIWSYLVIWFALAFPSCGSCGGLWELWVQCRDPLNKDLGSISRDRSCSRFSHLAFLKSEHT